MAGDQSGADRLVRIDDLRLTLATAFERLGLGGRDADDLAGMLVDAELRGHADHGASLVRVLAGFYREGKLNPRPHVRVVSESAGSLVLDGDGGCGPAAPMQAIHWCIERARETRGMAAAAIRDWQLLVAGPYARVAADHGLIGFACTNFVPLVAPPGGRSPVLGTNPFAYGIPAGRHGTVVLDVATTEVAMQKVRAAAQADLPLPPDIGFDRAGRPVTDPHAVVDGGLLAPLGAPHAPHKGFGLALVVDALSGVLSGGSYGTRVGTRPPSNFVWALSVEAFEPLDEFQARMDDLIDQVKSADRLPGVEELVVPGERGDRRKSALGERGVVPLGPTPWEVLSEECQSLGVAPPPLSPPVQGRRAG